MRLQGKSQEHPIEVQRTGAGRPSAQCKDCGAGYCQHALSAEHVNQKSQEPGVQGLRCRCGTGYCQQGRRKGGCRGCDKGC
jgi:hypothetical protein